MSSEKLLERTWRVLRCKHKPYRTGQRYLAWIRRFIIFHSKRHPAHMDQTEIEPLLTHLAVKQNMAASTHTAPPRCPPGKTRRSTPCSSSTATYSNSRSTSRTPL